MLDGVPFGTIIDRGAKVSIVTPEVIKTNLPHLDSISPRLQMVEGERFNQTKSFAPGSDK